MKGQYRYRQKRWHVFRLTRRYPSLCTYCGCSFTPTGKRQRTRDHVVPRIHGGRNRLSNLVLACAACNHRKGTMSTEAFLASPWLAARIKLVQDEKKGA